MKKTTVFILALLYLTITSGVMVNIHYCMGRPFLVDYGTSHDNDCGQCGMDKKPTSCCHTEHQLIKGDQPHLAIGQVSLPGPILASLSGTPATVFEAAASSAVSPVIRYHSPPDRRGSTLYLYHRVFRV